MTRLLSREQVVIFSVALITIAAGFISLNQEKAAKPLANEITSIEDTAGNVTNAQQMIDYKTTPEETFRRYSQLIDDGMYDDAISIVVIDSGDSYQKPSPHTQTIIKGEMTSVYGNRGENFEILKLDITAQEPLDERLLKKGVDNAYVLSYTMRYNLNGGLGVLSEKTTVVGIGGEWRVVYPGR